MDADDLKEWWFQKTGGRQMCTVYEVRANADSNEGRGPIVTLGYFKHRHVAVQYASDKGVMGSAGEVHERVALMLDEQQGFLLSGPAMIDSSGSTDDWKRAKALRKLTEEEKRLLGLL